MQNTVNGLKNSNDAKLFHFEDVLAATKVHQTSSVGAQEKNVIVIDNGSHHMSYSLLSYL